MLSNHISMKGGPGIKLNKLGQRVLSFDDWNQTVQQIVKRRTFSFAMLNSTYLNGVERGRKGEALVLSCPKCPSLRLSGNLLAWKHRKG